MQSKLLSIYLYIYFFSRTLPTLIFLSNTFILIRKELAINGIGVIQVVLVSYENLKKKLRTDKQMQFEDGSLFCMSQQH